MVSPRLLMNVMRNYNCSAMEAQEWLHRPCDEPFTFSSGSVYHPPQLEDIDDHKDLSF